MKQLWMQQSGVDVLWICTYDRQQYLPLLGQCGSHVWFSKHQISFFMKGESRQRCAEGLDAFFRLRRPSNIQITTINITHYEYLQLTTTHFVASHQITLSNVNVSLSRFANKNSPGPSRIENGSHAEIEHQERTRCRQAADNHVRHGHDICFHKHPLHAWSGNSHAERSQD